MYYYVVLLRLPSKKGNTATDWLIDYDDLPPPSTTTLGAL